MELNTRFEQHRGLWMTLERPEPWRREEMDGVQLGMLEANAIPGLLPLAVEEIDGEIRLRYRLMGCRMLSQMLRTDKWTMTDAMAALCKLAETAEQCHDHMLDFRQLLLNDDYIFVGDGWHDLRFSYVPLAASGAQADEEAGLERLVVRWMMRTENPDGKAMQQMLEMASSTEFVPSAMRSYARQYLCERAEERAVQMGGLKSVGEVATFHNNPEPSEAAFHANKPLHAGWPSMPSQDSMPEEHAPQAVRKYEQPGGASSWFRIDPDKLGAAADSSDEGEIRNHDEFRTYAIPGGMSASRWRTWLIVLSLIAIGIAWKTFYFQSPGSKGLILSLGASVACFGLCLYLWNGWSRKSELNNSSEPLADAAGNGFEPAVRSVSKASQDRATPGYSDRRDRDGEGMKNRFRKPGQSETDERFVTYPHVAGGGLPEDREHPRAEGDSKSQAHAWESKQIAGGDHTDRARVASNGASGRFVPFRGGDEWKPADDSNEEKFRPLTEWLPAKRDATELLAPTKADAGAPCYLDWESAELPCRISLKSDSLIIGRSREAAQHVDESGGVSRAHLEMLRQEGRWAAKDLGSRNGSWLNGTLMAPYETYTLDSGDCLQVAGSIYRFHAPGGSGPSA